MRAPIMLENKQDQRITSEKNLLGPRLIDSTTLKIQDNLCVNQIEEMETEVF